MCSRHSNGVVLKTQKYRCDASIIRRLFRIQTYLRDDSMMKRLNCPKSCERHCGKKDIHQIDVYGKFMGKKCHDALYC